MCICIKTFLFSDIFPFAGVARGGAAGPAEEAQRSWRWAGQILRVSEGCPGEAGASGEKSNRRKWEAVEAILWRDMQHNTVPDI